MTHRSISRSGLQTAFACLLLSIPCSSAFASDKGDEEEARRIHSREILMHENPELQTKSSWLSPNFHLHRKSGVGFAKKFELGERPLEFRVRGPVMRKQKALGLKFKLNF